MLANLFALGAIALWATLASLGLALAHLPPFLLTGLALLIGSVPAWPLIRHWKVPPRTLALGVYGLFGFHLLLFTALRMAPPVEANLVNYLWPLLIVALAPVLLPGMPWRAAPLIAAAMGFTGAVIAIAGTGGSGVEAGPDTYTRWGYLPALGSAFIWATYSLWTRRVPAFPTAAIGLFALVSGLLALACHVALEPRTVIATRDWTLVVAVGLGPLGAAFFLWDKALKLGDPRQLGILSYLTPLGSTLLLLAMTGQPVTPSLALAAALIVGSAALGMRRR